VKIEQNTKVAVVGVLLRGRGCNFSKTI